MDWRRKSPTLSPLFCTHFIIRWESRPIAKTPPGLRCPLRILYFLPEDPKELLLKKIPHATRKISCSHAWKLMSLLGDPPWNLVKDNVKTRSGGNTLRRPPKHAKETTEKLCGTPTNTLRASLQTYWEDPWNTLQVPLKRCWYPPKILRVPSKNVASKYTASTLKTWRRYFQKHTASTPKTCCEYF